VRVPDEAPAACSQDQYGSTEPAAAAKTAAVQKPYQWQPREAAHWDSNSAGTFPPRHQDQSLWSDLVQSKQAADSSGNPFEWVPEQDWDGSSSPSMRPKSAHMAPKTPTSMPLEYFDSPEMEQIDFEEELEASKAAGAPGLPAMSRFFTPQGDFSWAPCIALQQDRWVLRSPSDLPSESFQRRCPQQ
jgi:hypothetical protein